MTNQVWYLQFSTEDDAEYVNRNKARFRRRLKDRWSCKAVGHRYCFARLDGIHIPLSDDAIETWITALVRYYTLSRPIVPDIQISSYMLTA